MSRSKKLPSSVCVANHRIPVRVGELPQNEDGAELAGYFRASDQHGGEIYVDHKLGDGPMQVTFLHELLHAIDYLYGAKLKHRQVVAISSGLAQAIGKYIKF